MSPKFLGPICSIEKLLKNDKNITNDFTFVIYEGPTTLYGATNAPLRPFFWFFFEKSFKNLLVCLSK
jgi:hypothetical protein